MIYKNKSGKIMTNSKNDIIILAIQSFGFLLKRDTKISFFEFAQKIRSFCVNEKAIFIANYLEIF